MKILQLWEDGKLINELVYNSKALYPYAENQTIVIKEVKEWPSHTDTSALTVESTMLNSA